ncbi:MAG: Stp1/IreP family PP2C-type Ser/Thr phosphatase [Gaiellales bacterium]
MHIADHASSTHTGKVRRTNEDAFLDDPPLFVVADGMGGARAGEVASRLAIDTFLELRPLPDETGAQRLRRTILESNRRVLERSQSDPTAAGMGSTVTAALLEGDRVVLGHVGDSRAYLLRDDVLQQLSHDHSLVAELERAGRLTHEEAAVHPQRSVITRALGATDELDVDTSVVAVREGDVLLLCSDGLSGLIGDDAIAGLIGGGGRLDEAVRRLVRAANDAGGDDNVTAVAFRIGGDPGEPPMLHGPVSDERDLSDTLTEADAVPAIRLPDRPTLLAPIVKRSKRRKGLIAGFSTFAVLFVVLAFGAIFGLRWAHFVGVDPKTGEVAVFQGVPFDLDGSHHLYRLVTVSTVNATSLPRTDREKLFDHTLRSSGDAERILRQLQSDEP